MSFASGSNTTIGSGENLMQHYTPLDTWYRYTRTTARREIVVSIMIGMWSRSSRLFLSIAGRRRIQFVIIINVGGGGGVGDDNVYIKHHLTVDAYAVYVFVLLIMIID